RARNYGIRILGPNCLGAMNVFKRLNATFTDEMVMLGPLSFVSQSGALCTAAIHYAKEKKIGFSHFVSVGDKADIDDADLLEYLDRDPNTKCIAIYLESLKDGRKFFETALRVNKTTPIVVIKSGRTEAGAKAAASHTGSIAGSDIAYDAAFEQAGIYRVATLEGLFDCARALGYQPIPKGDRVAILTNSGGPGVLAADHAMNIGMHLAELSEDTLKKLNDYLPAAWSHSNPIDILGDATAVRYTEVIDILQQAPEVDSIIIILTPLSFTHPYNVSQQIVQIAKHSPKPILANYLGIISAVSGRYLDEHGVPEIAWTERTVRAMHALSTRSNFLRFEAQAEIPPTQIDVLEKKDRIYTIIEKARQDGRHILTLLESRDILKTLGIPLTSGVLLEKKEAIDSAGIGFPVAMKIVSKQITHKTDAGGVRINIFSAEEAKKAYDEIITNVKNYDPGAEIEGIWMEEMISGTELIIGTTNDPTFGKMIMFGLGGIYVEILKDVVFRLVPIHLKNAEAMYDKLKTKAILEGARGMPKVDRKKLEEMLVNVSEFVHKFPVKEMDINPLVVTRKGLKAIDARIILE
ncbi:MAG: acetate--CoA ligase family protein, partial [Thermoplasmata archaeon]|nr:acetate--CoA ligase family protein [Thermoplasmata archaeon]